MPEVVDRRAENRRDSDAVLVSLIDMVRDGNKDTKEVRDNLIVLTTKFDQSILTQADRQAAALVDGRRIDSLELWRASVMGSLSTIKSLVGVLGALQALVGILVYFRIHP